MAEKEYILRTEILEMLDERLKNAYYIEDSQEIGNEINELKAVIDIIEEDIPAADVEPVNHGEWQEITTHNGCTYDYDCVCSICGKSGIPSYDFCPHCGAKMDGKDKTNDEL